MAGMVFDMMSGPGEGAGYTLPDHFTTNPLQEGLGMPHHPTDQVAPRQSQQSMRVCQQCGREFKGHGNRPMKFCSKPCAGASRAIDNWRWHPCKQCGETFRVTRGNPGIYCSMACKAEWQRAQKPVDRDWLYEKYIVEGRSANYIARIVGRDSKRAWQWLRDYGIPTRSRGHNHAENPAFAYWLHDQDNPRKGRSLAAEQRRRLSEIAKADGRVPYDPAVGSYMKGRKGPDTPNWKGGVTPERHQFYSTQEWKVAARAVWGRDNATCQRCGKRNRPGERFAFDIHHIVSFACRELRAEPTNLVLLCEPCHYWIHSNENTGRLFIKEVPHDAD